VEGPLVAISYACGETLAACRRRSSYEKAELDREFPRLLRFLDLKQVVYAGVLGDFRELFRKPS
jgi:hypothetical protein